MSGLIIKDLATMKKSLFMVAVLFVAIGYMGISRGELSMVAGLSVMIPIILSSISFGYDARSNFQQFAFSMPIPRRDYVWSKLFFALVFGSAGAAAVFCVLLYQNRYPVGTAAVLSLAVLVTALFVLAVQLPFILKYGAEKGRLILVVSYFLIFGAIQLLRGREGLALGRLFGEGVSPMAVGTGMLIVGILAVFLLVRLSIRLLEAQEI